MGLLRLLTNRRVLGQFVLDQTGAWKVYDRLIADDRVVFVNEPIGAEQSWRELSKHYQASSNLWTDAYLAAFAAGWRLHVVTFDQAFARSITNIVTLLH